MAFTACTKEQLPVANYDIIPQPKEVQLNEEKPFELGPKTIVYYESGLQREAEFLSEYVNDIMGYALNVLEYQGQSDGIVLEVVPEDFDQAEAYEINITPKQVIIKGADASGVFYGIQISCFRLWSILILICFWAYRITLCVSFLSWFIGCRCL